jgi:hypothetical protein
MHGNISGTQNQHSHAEVLSFVKSLCSEVAVLRRVVTNTERAGAGGGSGSMSSPRTPRSTNSFMPFMPKSPVIPSDTAMPERLRMVEVRTFRFVSLFLLYGALTLGRRRTPF